MLFPNVLKVVLPSDMAPKYCCVCVPNASNCWNDGATCCGALLKFPNSLDTGSVKANGSATAEGVGAEWKASNPWSTTSEWVPTGADRGASNEKRSISGETHLG